MRLKDMHFERVTRFFEKRLILFCAQKCSCSVKFVENLNRFNSEYACIQVY